MLGQRLDGELCYRKPIPPGDTLEMTVTVAVSAALKEGEQATSSATVLGGGAPSATTSLVTTISSTPAQYGVEGFWNEVSGLNGLTDTQAGDHPYELTTRYSLNTAEMYGNEGAAPAGDPKDIVIDLPQGFVGNPQVVQKCGQRAAQTLNVPASSQIGVAMPLSLRHQPPA